MFALKYLFKELFAEKTRIILTILAIAWGTFAIASMLAIGEGLRVTFAKTIANTGKNLLVVRGGHTSRDYKGMHAHQKIKLRRQDYLAISKLPAIKYISPIYEAHYSTLKYAVNTTRMSIWAVNANYGKVHAIEASPGGRFISDFDMHLNRRVIVLGTKTAGALFPRTPNPVGEYVQWGGQPFLVIGVMKPKTQIIASQEADAFLNWIPTSTYKLMVNPSIIDRISISYKPGTNVNVFENKILKIVAIHHQANPKDDGIIRFDDLAQRQATVNSFFSSMQIFLGIVGALTLLVAGIGIANVMYASVKRATHDIGVRMAIGAKTFQILWHYIAESLAATFMGGIIGIILSELLVYGLNQIPLKGKLFQFIGQPHPELSWSVLLIVIIILGLMGFFAGLFPAMQASKVDPSEALIYE